MYCAHTRRPMLHCTAHQISMFHGVHGPIQYTTSMAKFQIADPSLPLPSFFSRFLKGPCTGVGNFAVWHCASLSKVHSMCYTRITFLCIRYQQLPCEISPEIVFSNTSAWTCACPVMMSSYSQETAHWAQCVHNCVVDRVADPRSKDVAAASQESERHLRGPDTALCRWTQVATSVETQWYNSQRDGGHSAKYCTQQDEPSPHCHHNQRERSRKLCWLLSMCWYSIHSEWLRHCYDPRRHTHQVTTGVETKRYNSHPQRYWTYVSYICSLTTVCQESDHIVMTCAQATQQIAVVC